MIGKAPFLLVTFLWARPKKSNSPKAKAVDVKDKAKSLDPRLRGDDERRATFMDPAFAGMTSWKLFASPE